MKKIAKIIGVTALILTLVCNLQYSFFFDVKDSPNAAKASYTGLDGTIYCGDSPQTDWKAGTWFYVDPSDPDFNTHVGATYSAGYWYFVQSNDGYDCGLNNPSSDYYFRQNGTYEVTAPKPTYAY
jgi:hypothetical protein